MRKLICLLCILSASVTASADVHVPRLFGDNTVLQQRTHNAVWGWADAGEKTTVEASWGAAASATAGPDGKSILFLETPGPGTEHSLTIRGKNTIDIENVAIGEVWLCAGQSNMGWAMVNSFEAEKEADVNYRTCASSNRPANTGRNRLRKIATGCANGSLAVQSRRRNRRITPMASLPKSPT